MQNSKLSDSEVEKVRRYLDSSCRYRLIRSVHCRQARRACAVLCCAASARSVHPLREANLTAIPQAEQLALRVELCASGCTGDSAPGVSLCTECCSFLMCDSEATLGVLRDAAGTAPLRWQIDAALVGSLTHAIRVCGCSTGERPWGIHRNLGLAEVGGCGGLAALPAACAPQVRHRAIAARSAHARAAATLCPLRVTIAAGGVEATALHCAHCGAMRPDCFAAERRAYRGSVRGCRDAPVCSVRTSAIGRLAPRWPAQPSLP